MLCLPIRCEVFPRATMPYHRGAYTMYRSAELQLMGFYRQAGNVQFQAHSNPVPIQSKAKYTWKTDKEGNRIGYRADTGETIVSYRTKLAPVAKAKPCGKGTIAHTLGNGLGVVILEPTRGDRKPRQTYHIANRALSK